MTCVTSVRYTVRFNGVMSAPFTPTRGLWQGDPLSPYLFLFIADGLSTLINRKVATVALRELVVCRNAPGVSHLLFADDTLLFFRASTDQAEVVKEILSTYGKCTGQQINLAKCSIMFNDKMQPALKEQVKSILQVEKDVLDARYLGVRTANAERENEGGPVPALEGAAQQTSQGLLGETHVQCSERDPH
jgi:hypothetical protein